VAIDQCSTNFCPDRFRLSKFRPFLSAHLAHVLTGNFQNFVRVFVKFLSAQGSVTWHDFHRSWCRSARACTASACRSCGPATAILGQQLLSAKLTACFLKDNFEEVILIMKKTPEDMNYSNWYNVPAYYLRQPVPVENLGESDKKDVLNLINVKWRRNLEKSTLKVHHKNISEIEKAKSTMTALDMDFYGYR